VTFVSLPNKHNSEHNDNAFSEALSFQMQKRSHRFKVSVGFGWSLRMVL